MSTLKQIEANRQNAQKSTGPKSDEGKAIARLNAVTHGLAAILPEAVARVEDHADIEQRKTRWRNELRPNGEQQEGLVDTLAVEAIRAERCRAVYFAHCSQHGLRARELWDTDRRDEAETLALGLAKDPRVVATRLEKTPHGCDVKLELWAGLSASLDRHRTWTDPQRSLALDLLGVHPHLRDAETAIDPANGDVYEARSKVVAREVDRLTVARVLTVNSDQSERELAAQTYGAEFTKQGQLIDRYERNSVRRYQWAWKTLMGLKRSDALPQQPISQINAPTPTCPEPAAIRLPAPVIVEPAKMEIVFVRERCEAPPVGFNRKQRKTLAALQRRA